MASQPNNDEMLKIRDFLFLHSFHNMTDDEIYTIYCRWYQHNYVDTQPCNLLFFATVSDDFRKEDKVVSPLSLDI